jgi:hypothetical protein
MESSTGVAERLALGIEETHGDAASEYAAAVEGTDLEASGGLEIPIRRPAGDRLDQRKLRR